jgi:hypothetical protein
MTFAGVPMSVAKATTLTSAMGYLITRPHHFFCVTWQIVAASHLTHTHLTNWAHVLFSLRGWSHGGCS